MEQAMAGKICMVTGANSGIGYETALGLAGMGADVVMVCRDETRGRASQESLKTSSGNASISLMLADLSSQEQVRRLAKDFMDKYGRLNVLVNNAGNVFGKRELTVDGIERTLAVNVLAYFMLANLLVPALKKGAPSRIVNVASRAADMGHMDFNDLQSEKNYSQSRAYSQSKLADIMISYELARRLKGGKITSNCLHPGLVSSNFGSSASGAYRALIRAGKFLMITPEQGAKTSIYLASSPEVEGVTGKYFIKSREAVSAKESYDAAAAARLWDECARLTKMDKEALPAQKGA